jgi:hypothetical protein
VWVGSVGFTGVGVGWKIPTLKKPSPAGKGWRVGAGFFFLTSTSATASRCTSFAALAPSRSQPTGGAINRSIDQDFKFQPTLSRRHSTINKPCRVGLTISLLAQQFFAPPLSNKVPLTPCYTLVLSWYALTYLHLYSASICISGRAFPATGLTTAFAVI